MDEVRANTSDGFRVFIDRGRSTEFNLVVVADYYVKADLGKDGGEPHYLFFLETKEHNKVVASIPAAWGGIVEVKQNVQ